MDKPCYIECSCTSAEHTLRITTDEEYYEMYVEVCLIRPSFWRRVWFGLKYIFGKGRGDFGETILDLEQIKKLHDLCDKLIVKDIIEVGISDG